LAGSTVWTIDVFFRANKLYLHVAIVCGHAWHKAHRCVHSTLEWPNCKHNVHCTACWKAFFSAFGEGARA
jgi:hypothetical protein